MISSQVCHSPLRLGNISLNASNYNTYSCYGYGMDTLQQIFLLSSCIHVIISKVCFRWSEKLVTTQRRTVNGFTLYLMMIHLFYCLFIDHGANNCFTSLHTIASVYLVLFIFAGLVQEKYIGSNKWDI